MWDLNSLNRGAQQSYDILKISRKDRSLSEPIFNQWTRNYPKNKRLTGISWKCNIKKSINTLWIRSDKRMDNKVPMWHQKDGIGKMYNIFEDNVTWRSTNYIRNVTTKYKLINDRQWHSNGTVRLNYTVVHRRNQ